MPEVQDIIKALPKEFIAQLSPEQRKVLFSISNCRTAVLGTHITSCNRCEYEEFSYNSCRNRHCPKCQTFKREEWIRKQEQYLLDIPYFHVVFTLPDTLNHLILQNQKVIYNLFFKCVSETISELTTNEKYLGAKSGVTAVLHTWGQNLSFHPHIHCIIPGGGLKDNNFWVNSKKKFFLPVKVLSRKFRGKFIHYLKDANLDFYNSTEYLKDDENFAQFLSHLYQKE